MGSFRKVAVILLVIVFVATAVALQGCGTDVAPPPQPPQTSTGTTTTTTGTTTTTTGTATTTTSTRSNSVPVHTQWRLWPILLFIISAVGAVGLLCLVHHVVCRCRVCCRRRRAADALMLRSDRARTWSAEQVVGWLRIIGLGQYEANFTQNSVNGQVLLTLEDAEINDDLRLRGHHNVVLRSALAMLNNAASHPAPSRVVDFGLWGWGHEDICRWLDFLGLGVMRIHLQRVGIHGALLFPPSPLAGAAGSAEAGLSAGALTELVARALEEALKFRRVDVTRIGDSCESREAAASLLRTSLTAAVAAAAPAYAAGVTAMQLMNVGRRDGPDRGCCEHCCSRCNRSCLRALHAAPALPQVCRCLGFDRHSAAFWGAAKAREWLERRADVPSVLAQSLEALGCHGAMLLEHGFEALVLFTFPLSVTPLLARRLRVELATLRAVEGIAAACTTKEPSAPLAAMAPPAMAQESGASTAETAAAAGRGVPTEEAFGGA